MDDNTVVLPSTGVIKKDRQPSDRMMLAFAAAAPVFDWSKASVDDGDPQANAFGIPDKEQNGSGSCTCQSVGYGMYKGLGVDISRHDPYGNVHLPGGGAYLNAPLDWLRKNGYVLLSRYPEPNPETEQAMEEILTVADGDRVRTFLLTYNFSPVTNIDAAAIAIANHTFTIMGIDGSWKNGWNGSWTDPSFVSGSIEWAHSIMAGQAVIRHGKKAIKNKSSWTTHRDYKGQQSYVHFINEDYFNAGGVFEIIGVDVKELDNMQNKKFIIQLGTGLGVLELTPEGELVGKIATDGKEFHDLGVKLGIHAVDVDASGNPINGTYATPTVTGSGN